jgi:hypothetical protein
MNAALHYGVKRKIAVLPLVPGGKVPVLKGVGVYNASTDETTIRDWWWKQCRKANIGWAVPQGIVVLDVDSPEALGMLRAQDLDLPTTTTVKTPNGWHFIYRTDTHVGNRVKLFPGVDTRALGGYGILPPSRNGAGLEYSWEIPLSRNNLTEAPEWLVEQATIRKLAEVDQKIDPAEVLQGVSEGGRDTTLFRYACRLRGQGMAKVEALTLVRAAAANCSPPFPDTQAIAKVESAWKYDPNPQPEKVELKGWKVKDLLKEKFRQPKWFIPGYLGEGLTLLFSPGKIGKSTLMRDWCWNVSTGQAALGTLQTNQCGVLYLDLEESEIFAQENWAKLAEGCEPPDNLHTYFKWPTMDQGGIEAIDAFLVQNTDVHLVVVDVLTKLWPIDEKKSGNAYHMEYRILDALKQIAHRHQVGVVAVHHDRKGDDKGNGDWMNRASGSRAMTGAPDTVMLLERKREDTDGNLRISGKHVRERSLPLVWNPNQQFWLDASVTRSGRSATSEDFVEEPSGYQSDIPY